MKHAKTSKMQYIFYMFAGLLIGLPVAVAQQQPASFTEVASEPASARAARISMGIHDTGTGEVLHIFSGHSMVIHAETNIKRIYVGNPAVLQSYPSAPNEIVLTAKGTGLSSLVIWNTAQQSCLYTVDVDIDPQELSRSLHEAFPGTDIHVDGHAGRIYLAGIVPSKDVMDGVLKLATVYGSEIVNAMRIVPPHAVQVQLKLRIVEIDRTRMEQYGFNFFTGGKTPVSVSTQQFASTGTITPGASGTTASVSDPLNIFLYSQALNVGVTVKDLEQKQILQVLAEPTLTAISGESARFLSGGEFPFPVVQGGTGAATAITIMFQPYGVKVDFTPTVNEDGTIRLKLAPEVSTLDFTNAVTISGFTIPALSTRRAETEVEIRSGQTFAVSGLLDHRTTESLSHVPGISSIPILGQLFRSKAYNHSIVELVVLVTATVVDPLTDHSTPAEPQPVVPNLDPHAFDTQLGKMQKINAKQ